MNWKSDPVGNGTLAVAFVPFKAEMLVLAVTRSSVKRFRGASEGIWEWPQFYACIQRVGAVKIWT